MTGTSLDGLDIAFVKINGQGLSLNAELVELKSFELKSFSDSFRKITRGEPFCISEYTLLRDEFSRFHASCLEQFSVNFDLISVHGQTLFHQPPASLQLINPALIAIPLNTTTVYDFRLSDLACGGEGAPITPLADYLMFAHEHKTVAVINLGGFCNVTILPPSQNKNIDSIKGFDVCTCNHLLNHLSETRLDQPYDDLGQVASLGVVDEDCLKKIYSVLKLQMIQKRSMGNGDECFKEIELICENLNSQTAMNTVCESLVKVILESVGIVSSVVLAGGGCLNACLVEKFRSKSKYSVHLSDEKNVPVQAREAIAMAILGALSQDNVPITLPPVTGATRNVLSGCWVYP